MSDCPKWFTQALVQRFNELSLVAEQQDRFLPVVGRASHLLMELMNQADVSIHGVILEWEETVCYQHSLEKEWLYFEGVKDGMRLMNSTNSKLGG